MPKRNLCFKNSKDLVDFGWEKREKNQKNNKKQQSIGGKTKKKRKSLIGEKRGDTGKSP